MLGVLWWSWTGYAWLTSVVDPEAGAVRLAIFAAMAAFLVAALAIPNAFGDDGLIFAAAYAFVRIAHIWLFTIASRDDPGLRKSVVGLAAGTTIGVTLLLVASATDGALQLVLWGLALGLDAAGPYLIGADGWKLMPAHFAERHGLILIIALGESIVAIGVGSDAVVDSGVIVAAVLGIAIAAALWWLYFDVTVWVAQRQFTEMEPGRDQNELARDAYSYIHFAMVAGIVLLALGAKKTLEHVGDDLKTVPAVALVGGVALYLLALVAFRLRIRRTLRRTRLDGGPRAARVPATRRSSYPPSRRSRSCSRSSWVSSATSSSPTGSSGSACATSSHATITARARRRDGEALGAVAARVRRRGAGAQDGCVFCDEAAGRARRARASWSSRVASARSCS